MMLSQIITLLVVASLIFLIAWWFFGKHQADQVSAVLTGGTQTVRIQVNGGYTPEKVVLKAGIPAKLEFERQDPSSCLEEVVFSDFGIKQFLPEKEVTTIKLTPQKPGEYTYACGMDMFHGQVIVK